MPPAEVLSRLVPLQNALKLSQQQLQKSLAFADAVIDTVREPLLVLDAGLRVLRANQAFYDKFDLSREAIAFQPIHEIGDRQWDVPELRALLEKVIAEDESFRDFRLAQSFGRVGEKSMLLNGRRTAPRGEEQPLILLAMEDDTERQQAEDRFREAQKLDSVGRLAAGIAHDFNNLLNIISAYASVLVERGIDPGRHAEGFEAIQRAVRRGSALVRQLLTFARKTEVVFDAVTLNTVVEEIVEILRATFPKEIVVEADLAADLPEIKADANQLHQAVLNLCVNARDAIPDGGTITVQTEQVNGEELRGRFADAAGKTYASVKVSDNGIGMDRGTSSRMFDPFFTTKNPGAGQGLGLAVVHGIVQSHHGFIDVSSEPGQGTAVQLFFPVSPGAQDAAGSRAESPVSRSAHGEKPRSTGGNETILLVEDEDMLREPVKSLLEGKGYRVLCARDGLEAVELYEREGKGIDLVILDVGLPRQ